MNQRVAGLSPGQGTSLGCRPCVPSRGHTRGNHTLMFLSFPSPFSKNKFKNLFKKRKKGTEVEEVSCRRSGLTKQVTEAQEGPLECRRKRQRKHTSGRGVGKGEGVLRRESQPIGSSLLKAFHLLSKGREFQGRSQGRISMEYSSAFQVCPLRFVVSTRSIGTRVTTAGPAVSHGIACLVLLLFWAWS